MSDNKKLKKYVGYIVLMNNPTKPYWWHDYEFFSLEDAESDLLFKEYLNAMAPEDTHFIDNKVVTHILRRLIEVSAVPLGSSMEQINNMTVEEYDDFFDREIEEYVFDYQFIKELLKSKDYKFINELIGYSW